MAKRPPLPASTPTLKGARLIETPAHPLLIELKGYWQAKRDARGGKLPGRADVDPMELRNLLPHIFLIDALPPDIPGEKRDYRVRLMGTAHTALYGDGHVGKKMEAMFGDYTRVFTNLYDRMCVEKTCFANEGHIFWWRNAEFITFEAFHAPLAANGEHVDMILGAGIFDYGHEAD